MQENSNKLIFVNSLILYVRLGLITICSLFTTRFALKALGVVDYGLFSVLGSIITFIGIFNTIMLSTSNRFITVAIGRGDNRDVNKTFNVNLLIHILIAISTLILAIPIGLWYIHNFINYDGTVDNAIIVYIITILGSVLSFVGVPYNGLLMAKERFAIFCFTDVFVNFLKLIIAYLLISHFSRKLQIYAVTVAFTTALPTLIFYLYCKAKFPDIISFRIVREKKRYKEIFNFSAWVAYGAVATVGKTQGAALLVNYFFNTVMNTALGIANTVNQMVMTVSQNVAKPIAPQITKSYASGNMDRCDSLLVKSTKYSYLVMLLVSMPFFIDCEWILSLWLGDVPKYAVHFTILLIIDALIGTLDAGISNLIFANGNIKLYQIVINTVRLSAIILAFFLLKSGLDAEFLLYTYILCNIIAFLCCLLILSHTLKYNIKSLIRKSYIPSIFVTVLSMMFIFIPFQIIPFVKIFIGTLWTLFISWFVGLNHNERTNLIDIVKK